VDLLRFQTVALDPPIPIRYALEIDVCIDGKSPDSDLRRSVEQKGKSALVPPDGRKGVSVEMNITGEYRLARKALR